MMERNNKHISVRRQWFQDLPPTQQLTQRPRYYLRLGDKIESRKSMKVEIKGNELIITVVMQTPTPSASGKTLVIASSHGNQTTTAIIDGKPVIVGLNAYIKK